MSRIPEKFLSMFSHLPPDMTNSEQDMLKTALENGFSEYLPDDQEMSPFTMYLLGADYEDIAKRTKINYKVILLTALKNRWYDRKKTLGISNPKQGVVSVFQKTVNSILAATSVLVEEECQNVMSGKKKGKDTQYLPKDIYGLEKFLTVVDKLHKISPTAPAPQQTIVVEAPRLSVNVANLPQNSIAQVKDMPQLPSMTMEEYENMSREDRLAMLSASGNSEKKKITE